MGTITESMERLRDEIVTLRQRRSLAQAELIRGAAERRAGVGAMRMAFTRDRALAHRAWFGPTVVERRAELQKERRLAEEAKVHAQTEQKRKLAEEAKVHAHAEQERRLAKEAKAHAHAEQERKIAEEARAAAQAEQDRKAAEAKAHAQAEQKRRLAEEARAVAHAEQDRKLAAEAKARMEAESKAALAEETAAAHVVPQAAQKHNSADRHPASRPHKVSQEKPSKKRHSSK